MSVRMRACTPLTPAWKRRRGPCCPVSTARHPMHSPVPRCRTKATESRTAAISAHENTGTQRSGDDTTRNDNGPGRGATNGGRQGGQGCNASTARCAASTSPRQAKASSKSSQSALDDQEQRGKTRKQGKREQCTAHNDMRKASDLR